MNRRQALQTMMGALGLFSVSQVVGAEAFLSAAHSAVVRPVLSRSEVAVLNELGETILPATDASLGAKAAGIGEFMQAMVSGHYALSEQQIFLRGLADLARRSERMFQTDVRDLSTGQWIQLVQVLEQDGQAGYYQMIKQLTVWGYFASEVGAKQALRYVPIPGRYDGDVNIEPGTKAWANLLS